MRLRNVVAVVARFHDIGPARLCIKTPQVFLSGLGGIVGTPALAIGRTLLRLLGREWRLPLDLPVQEQPDGGDMLARLLAQLEIVTIARGGPNARVHGVARGRRRLGRDDQNAFLIGDSHIACQLQSFRFPNVHRATYYQVLFSPSHIYA